MSSALVFPLSAFVFPLCFFLVAVPWPTLVEQTVIQGLTRADASATCELLGWIGVPVMAHGNVIEVATGEVGIDEACSGIRSFQATLMISFFLGELYQLSVRRRAVLCLAGFAMSFLFNLARMSLLVWVAARQGISAIAAWHDPAGVTILVACFWGLWGLGECFNKRQKSESQKLATAERFTPWASGLDQSLTVRSESRVLPSSNFHLPFSISLGLFIWLLLTEIAGHTTGR